ncbi:hypothetical protein [Frankia sp. Cr2]|uniref:hypothetical protein n=1 Tax=Frankia sp. Cr2 TaxID=3073932 RepID=UPI002AD3B4E6|nr:hypothetical protein [Frankia sp. Cr2]
MDVTVRDRLASLAQDRGTTMGRMLAEIVETLERESFFARARVQLEELRAAAPEEWDRDRNESRAWQHGTDRDALALDDTSGWWE